MKTLQEKANMRHTKNKTQVLNSKGVNAHARK